MIVLLVASAISLSGLQASIAAPTEAFRGCLHDAANKAKGDKVAGDAIETYLKGACTVQMGTLKQALVAFRMKNGMSRKAAADDADMTVDDYVSTPADNYKFIAEMEAKAAGAAAPASTASAAPKPASATPAAAPSQPPKP